MGKFIKKFSFPSESGPVEVDDIEQKIRHPITYGSFISSNNGESWKREMKGGKWVDYPESHHLR